MGTTSSSARVRPSPHPVVPLPSRRRGSAGTLNLLCAALCAALSGCADHDFRKAARLEAKGEAAQAARAFERFLEKHPDDARAPEAAYRAGAIHAEKFGQCRQAVPLFEQAARSSVKTSSGALPSPWPEKARLALLSCPDYFPFPPGGRWEYVDTLSGGQNMRLEISVSPSTGPAGADAGTEVSGSYYAGQEKFRDYRKLLSREGWSLWEEDAGVKTPVLRFPFRKGRSWQAQLKGEKVDFLIEEEDTSVKTKAGEFSGCLKVKQHHVGFASWTYDYFCPAVGRVKTTVGVPGEENPNTELASYKLK